MSRILAIAVAATLLGVSACKNVGGEAPKPSTMQPVPEASVAPTPAEVSAAEAAPAVPATPAPPTPAPEAPIAEAEAPVAPAAPAAPAPAAKQDVSVKPAPKPAPVTKEQAMALAAKGNCLACHKIDSRLVGPAWKDVAAKYRNDANAVGTIASHIKSGGAFGWKFGTMPPRGGSKISDADVTTLARFIAGLK